MIFEMPCEDEAQKQLIKDQSSQLRVREKEKTI